jgi:FkbM family methyltransferase
MARTSSLRAYFRVRPRRFVDALRLFSAYAISAFLKIAIPSRFASVGLVTRGRRDLQVAVDGIAFDVRPRTNDLDLISPKHEPITSQWFQVRPNDVVVDVGAHLGRYALRAAANGARVIAIEPDPTNFRLLERNVKLNGRSNVALVEKALTATPGTLRLSLAPAWNTGTSSVRSPTPGEGPAPQTSRVIAVPGDTLDNIVRSYGLSRIDWLKIDVEGHEISVLEGGGAALDITRRLILEVSDGTGDACRRIVEGHGFGLVAVEPGKPTSNWLLTKAPS